ncbi:MAG TPA: twin-arginine translocase TatA/TatE family subunit [Pirellulales bacterium]|nr:twin-arginine translocase TatA/TatE family subunit [Pirellulales bacterium]
MSLLFGFGTHPWEILIIGAVILLLFGHKLPSLMRSMGRSVVEFKKGIKEIDEDDGEAPPGDEKK